MREQESEPGPPLGAPAAAAPTGLTAANFRLKATSYSSTVRELDVALPNVSVSDVVTSANRTGSACRPHASHRVAAFCWESGDNDTNDWYPQGITTSADAYGEGTYEGKTMIVTSWYDHNTADVKKGARVSFVDYSTPIAPKYRHVLLVEPDTSAGEPTFKPVLYADRSDSLHAGGLFWYGYYLYVADTRDGFRVFDMRHLYKVTTGDKTKIGRQSDGTYHAFDYQYVLPQAFRFAASTTGGYSALRYSAASLDRTSTPHSVVVPEYDAAGTGTRVVRFPINYTDRMLKASSDGYVHGIDAYRVDIKSMQGATAINGKFYVSASAGPRTYGSLWTFTRSSGPTHYAQALPIGNEDLSYSGPKDQLWTLSEYPGKRYVVAVKASAF